MRKILLGMLLTVNFIGVKAFAFELDKLKLSSDGTPRGGWQCYESFKELAIDTSNKTFTYSDRSGGCYGPFVNYRGHYVESYTEYNNLLKISFIAETTRFLDPNSVHRKIFEVHIDVKKNKLQIYGLSYLYTLYEFKTLAETGGAIKFKEYKFDQVEFDIVP